MTRPCRETIHTEPYVEGKRTWTAPFVDEKDFAAIALDGYTGDCVAEHPTLEPVQAGDVALMFVSGTKDEQACNGNGGVEMEVFAKLGGCWRHAGQVPEQSRLLSRDTTQAVPIFSMWHMGALDEQRRIWELHDGRFVAVDEAMIINDGLALTPNTVDESVARKLQNFWSRLGHFLPRSASAFLRHSARP